MWFLASLKVSAAKEKRGGARSLPLPTFSLRSLAEAAACTTLPVRCGSPFDARDMPSAGEEFSCLCSTTGITIEQG